MQKIYLLLRNNKQSGPYSLNELVALPLNAMDLLWVEGKSKTWAHPDSLEELKAHVKTDKKASDSLAVYPKADHKLVLPRTSAAKQEEKKQEAIKVQVYVALPNQFPADHKAAQKTLPEHTSPEPSTSFLESAGDDDADNYTLSTKYVRDLDEIKEQYSAWIGKQKSYPKGGIERNRVLLAVMIFLVAAAGFVAERWGGNSNTDQLPLHPKSVKVISNAGQPQPVKNAKKKKSGRSTEKKDQNKKAVTLSITSGDTDNEEKMEVQADSGKAVTNNSPENKPDAATLFQQLEIKYVFDTSRQHGISGLNFHIHNRSAQKLNTVALTVFYNDANGHQLSKETIYFNHLPPGATGSQHAPANEKAVAVAYKIAMVSLLDSIYYGKE